MKIVCVSDTHGRRPNLPHGDVLIFAGDLLCTGHPDEFDVEVDFLRTLPHPHKILVAGNHDLALQRFPHLAAELPGHYLQDSGVEIGGAKFWGSPWLSYADGAFGLQSREACEERWARIPNDTQVLITHSPAFGILDKTWPDQHLGCPALAKRIGELPHLQLHVHGHVHHARGAEVHGGILRVNAAATTLNHWLYAQFPVVSIGDGPPKITWESGPEDR